MAVAAARLTPPVPEADTMQLVSNSRSAEPMTPAMPTAFTGALSWARQEPLSESCGFW